MIKLFRFAYDDISKLKSSAVNCGCGCGTGWGPNYRIGLRNGANDYYNQPK